MSGRGTLERVAEHLAMAVQPLREAVADLESFQVFMLRLGWEVESLPPEYQQLAAVASSALDALPSPDAEPEVEELAVVFARVKALYDRAAGLTVVPAGVESAAFLADFVERLFELLLLDRVKEALPGWYNALSALGIIDEEYHHETPTRPTYSRSRLRLDRVPGLFVDPLRPLAVMYGWGTDELAFDRVALHLIEFCDAIGLYAYLRPVDPEFGQLLLNAPAHGSSPLDLDPIDPFDLDPTEWMVAIPLFVDEIGGEEVEVGLRLVELAAEDGKLPGLVLQPLVPAVVGTEFAIDDELTLRLRAGSDLGKAFGVRLRPGELSVRYPFEPGTELSAAGFGASLDYRPRDAPVLLLGQPGGSRVELAGATFRFRVDVVAGVLEVAADVELQGLTVVVTAAELDGFLDSVLGGGDVAVPVSLGMTWSSTAGVSFTGAGGFEAVVTAGLRLGPVTIDRLVVALRSGVTGGHPRLTALVGVGISGRLGPATFAVDGLGLGLDLVFAPGNAGPLGLAVGLRPPTRLRVALKTGPVEGGGFVALDPARGSYAGVLQLTVGGIDVSAFGVLDTKDAEGNDLPDPGFSFLIILFADIPPVQIGFGFRLTGIGGLIGIYRDSNYELLKAGLTAGALDSVMFPPDPANNADQVIRDLTMLFPQKADRHIIGPMLRLEWGSPTLVRIEVGILIVSGGPVPVQLLGQLSAELPSADEALIRLNIDMVGEANFAAGTLTVDAALRNSTIVGFPLTGEAAVRARWKTSPTFGVTFGGFHPDYTPEASFPDLKPLALTISNGSNLRLVAESYLAVTSNSLQFGARAELYAKAAGFSVEGYLEMHMLIIVSPFSFAASIAFDVSLRFKGRNFASIGLAFDLSGPLPWRAKGKLKIKIAFVTFNLSFNISWGSAVQPVLPPRPVWPDLRQALSDIDNWACILPPESKRDVLVLPRKEQGAVIMHPHGVLEVRQRVAPFDLELQRFGSGPPQGDARFLLPTLTVGGVIVPGVASVEEDFAPGQFLDLTEDEKLSRPSFERMPAGIRFGSTAVRAGNAQSLTVEYETQIVGPEGPSRRPGPLDLFAEFATDSRLFRLSLGERVRNTAAAESRYKNQGRDPAVSLKPERYLVAEDVTATTGPDTSSSIAIASQAIRRSMSTLRLEGRGLVPVGLSEFS